MKKIAVLNSDESLNHRILTFCDELGREFEPIFLREKAKCLEYLNYELPEISVFNFMDKSIDIYSVLDRITADPWLHYGGIIGIFDNESEKEIVEKVKDTNIVSLIQKARFDFSFPRVLRIVKQNRQILFQRHIQNQFLSNISGAFIIDNDPFDVVTYAHLVSNYLFNSNYINLEKKECLNVALSELLINSIEHGNCKISFQEKSEWLDSGREIFDLIRRKNQDAAINKKKVFFEYRISQSESTFIIRDEGDGFKWRDRKKQIQSGDPLALCGRGIMMAEIYVSDLEYNAKGNEVRFKLYHQQNESNVVPEVFIEQEEVVFQKDEIVFQEGEESNFLYYIVSGMLNIIANGKVISYLTPADIFLGEMSFLLNNKRSATVRSEGKSVLLKISKEAFLDAIKKNPHYGIFLARLLAQRINRLNQQSSSFIS
ncbi:MAG: cyclic nucleotide-binding domain-containing protein [Spirochaetales bacterium]|nr:cyclic nucleotide-binding domain-containing protein [Spirochaetales bacterium]